MGSPNHVAYLAIWKRLQGVSFRGGSISELHRIYGIDRNVIKDIRRRAKPWNWETFGAPLRCAELLEWARVERAEFRKGDERTHWHNHPEVRRCALDETREDRNAYSRAWFAKNRPAEKRAKYQERQNRIQRAERLWCCVRCLLKVGLPKDSIATHLRISRGHVLMWASVFANGMKHRGGFSLDRLLNPKPWHGHLRGHARRIREKLKRENDPKHKLRVSLRARFTKAFKRKRIDKAGRALDLVGCSIPFLRKHLESKFSKWMTWDNYGRRWHIDHIQPLNSFDLTKADDRRMAFHWTNLRPLASKKNVAKGAKITEPQLTLLLPAA